jgi:hypothetical protein
MLKRSRSHDCLGRRHWQRARDLQCPGGGVRLGSFVQVNLTRNVITDKGVAPLADMLAFNRAITEFDIRLNRLTVEGGLTFYKAVSALFRPDHQREAIVAVLQGHGGSEPRVG